MSIVRYFFFLVCFLFVSAEGRCFDRDHIINGKASQRTKIENVTIKRFDDVDLRTIRERFNKAEEHQYYRCFARDSEDTYSGVYFIVGLNKSVASLPENVFVNIYLINSLQEGVRAFKCKVSGNRWAITSEIYCGITSENIDIEGIKAWKIDFVDNEGKILFSKKSYFWES